MNILSPHKIAAQPVLFEIDEYADYINLLVLHNYLKSKEARVHFTGGMVPFESQNHRSDFKSNGSMDENHIVVSGYSDNNPGVHVHIRDYCTAHIQIDLSILKSCHVPRFSTRDEARAALKIPLEEKTILLAYVNDDENIWSCIEDIFNKGINRNFRYYLFGDYGNEIEEYRKHFSNQDVEFITEVGRLKSYTEASRGVFPFADLMSYIGTHFHNLFELTQRAPLHLFRTAAELRSSQYGFHELVRMGAIRLHDNLGDVIASVLEQAQREPTREEEHIVSARCDFIEHNRRTFLPYLAELIADPECSSSPPAGLAVYQRENVIRVMHKKTTWYKNDHIIP